MWASVAGPSSALLQPFGMFCLEKNSANLSGIVACDGDDPEKSLQPFQTMIVTRPTFKVIKKHGMKMLWSHLHFKELWAKSSNGVNYK